MPAYFISHGSPDIVLRRTPAAQFLENFSGITPTTKAILVISAHWMTEEPMVTAHPHPETIHDFGGFPQPLYELQYPAAGNALLAAETVSHLKPAFPLAALDVKRGLDHGAWIPLLLAVPQAQIPVLQLSIQPHRDAAHHYEVGKRLHDLREQGVAIIASGNATHNLRAVFTQRYDEPPDQVTRFNDWLHGALVNSDIKTLLQWEHAPDAAWNHPTNDHFLPLFTALGAASAQTTPQRIHESYDYGVLSMDSYAL